MTQNVYDQESFFHAYSELPRSRDGLASAPEWPTLQGMLGAVSDRAVLDLGCGYGWFARWARGAGARSVHGVDLSERMIARAREFGADAAVSYAVADLETLELAPAGGGGGYDVVYSSLTFHYVHALERLFRQVHGALSPGGRFVFSAEHPIFTAPRSATAAFLRHDDGDGQGGEYWPLDGYADEGPRTKRWIGQEVVKVHRTVGAYVQLLIRSGFTLTGLVEWMPTPELVKENPGWQAERERPMFLLISAQKT